MSTEASFDVVALKADFEALPAGDDRSEPDRWSASLVASLEVRVTISPISHPGEVFIAVSLWSRYPDEAPSVKFVEPETWRSDVPSAWPTGGPFRPTIGLCCNYTAEGFGMHPEWVKDKQLGWRSDGNVLLKVIRFLQDDLDSHCTGRHP